MGLSQASPRLSPSHGRWCFLRSHKPTSDSSITRGFCLCVWVERGDLTDTGSAAAFDCISSNAAGTI